MHEYCLIILFVIFDSIFWCTKDLVSEVLILTNSLTHFSFSVTSIPKCMTDNQSYVLGSLALIILSLIVLFKNHVVWCKQSYYFHSNINTYGAVFMYTSLFSLFNCGMLSKTKWTTVNMYCLNSKLISIDIHGWFMFSLSL